VRSLNPIAIAVPFFFLLIAIEVFAAKRLKKEVYRLDDALSDLGCGLWQQVLVIFMRVALTAAYSWLWAEHRLMEISSDSTLAWIVLFFGVDFFYYWFHRTSHEVNALWAAHVVHHQSEEYNLAVALRQAAFQPACSWMFYLPLAVLGFPPEMFLLMASFNTLYQFWIHTRLIGRMGPLELFLNTPSHHRVHHGRDPKYIDKNHAGILIIWDKLFGTFQKEEEEPTYGVTLPVRSWNPIWANFHYWAHLVAVARTTPKLSDKVRLFFAKPSWLPPEATVDESKYVALDAEKFGSPVPRAQRRFALAQFVVAFFLAAPLSILADLDPTVMFGLGIAVTAVLAAMGALLDRPSERRSAQLPGPRQA
jgi:alkylglycerol monooxygenase